jgi:hypothetical protein
MAGISRGPEGLGDHERREDMKEWIYVVAETSGRSGSFEPSATLWRRASDAVLVWLGCRDGILKEGSPAHREAGPVPPGWFEAPHPDWPKNVVRARSEEFADLVLRLEAGRSLSTRDPDDEEFDEEGDVAIASRQEVR